jgi:hypothetical protein
MLIQEQLFEPEVNFGSCCGSRPKGGGKNRPVKRREREMVFNSVGKLNTEAAAGSGEK